MKKWAPLASALLLAGCAVGPDYERPELGAVQQDFRVPIELQQARSLAAVEWFEMFNDPYLNQLVQVALANNLELAGALERVEQARARTAVSRSAFGPQIRGSVQNTPAPGGDGNDASFTSGVGFNWELDLLGKLRRADEATRAELLATEDGARAVMSSLVVSVAQAWFSLQELDEEERILVRTLGSQEESLELVRSQLNSGVASRAEEQQAIAQLASTRARLPQVQQQVVFAENTLSLLLGQAPQAFADRPQRRPVTLLDDKEVALGLPVELLERRPDVRAAEQRLHAATARVGVAVANRFPVPTIGLSGLFGRYSTDLNDLYSGSATNFSGWGPYIDIPIIDWGRAKGNEDAARAAMAEALTNYRRTVLIALREVSDSVYAFTYSAEVIDAQLTYAEAAAESLSLQKSRFASGVSGYVNVLDAERELLSAEIGLSQAELSRVNAYLEIYRSLGGGWSDEALQRALSDSPRDQP
ncbi:efflux transporter outer membrane subunit [Halopseudomonas maritima]|uniref:efflux transporter outer membrane subunit n=1 Tax=Halopseudomonas maritima TaxID=2918528 RepID=UPI001EEAEC7C|nr:efflux transporter outer membrane subunit [Halopseudomonas maritima]UJJ32516.1 efflux transporter outer membrane subunit [Halopseudomonas maritima]